MEDPGGRSDAALHAGDDLDAAAASSRFGGVHPLRAGVSPFDRALRVAGEIGDLRWWRDFDRERVVTGVEASTGEPMTIRFRGNLKIVDFCTKLILGSDDYHVLSGARPGDEDLVVDYHGTRNRLLRRKDCLYLPHRVSQYLPLGVSWDQTLSALSPKHRKELRRHLRKYRFTPVLCHGVNAVERFYHEAFSPYALSRFGEQASIGDPRMFRLKFRNAAVLWLLADGVPVGANLLTRRGERLYIEHCGLTPGSERLPGLFDCLDYFSLLLAQLTDCRELDFGGSRPHLRHGIFCYKAKWNTRVRQPGRFATSICIRIARHSETVRGFLMRNLFLQSLDGKLVVKVLSNGRMAGTDGVETLRSDAQKCGIDEWLVVREDSAASAAPKRERRRRRSASTAVAAYLET